MTKSNSIFRAALGISLLSLFVLFLTGSPYRIIITVIIFLALICFCYIETKNNTVCGFSFICFISSLVLLILRSYYFFLIWSPSSIIHTISDHLLISSDMFLIIIGVVCVICSFGSVYFVTYTLFEKRKKLMTVLLFSMLSYWQIQISSGIPIIKLGCQDSIYLCINTLILSLFIYVIDTIVKKNSNIPLLLVSIGCTALSVINHYVIEFHGSPLFPNEFHNFRDAVNVLPGYHFSLDFVVLLILLVFGIQLLLLIHSRAYFKTEEKQTTKKQLVTIAILSVIILSGLNTVFIKDPPAMWSWGTVIYKDGFLISSIASIRDAMYPLKELKEYDNFNSEINDLENDKLEKKEEFTCPDIFIIVNESFCNLGENSELDTDVDYLHDFYNIPNAVYGYTASSMIGSGTNNSEFEVLTSNSMYMLNSSAPFTYLNLEGLDSGIVSYLKAFGYNTTALHCMAPTNYSRNKAYPSLGFDKVILGSENFTLNHLGNRPFLDADNYLDMLAQYTSNDEQPQFFYLLTFQNHGGYDQNDDSMDQVHIKNDYGKLSSSVNEYLTSIYIAGKAFHELTDTLSKSDRPAVVMMVGDHPPSFMTKLSPKNTRTQEELDISQRTVPFVMWSNYSVHFSQNIDFASMVDLVPLMLDSIGFPLTPYYRTILSLHEQVPLRLYNGVYRDKKGTIGVYSEGSPYYDLMTKYYNMEYNGLKREDDYRKELFILDVLK